MKSTLRIIILGFLLMLAVSGIAMVPIFPKREPMNKETTIELAESDADEELP